MKVAQKQTTPRHSTDELGEYNSKRDFCVTTEPRGTKTENQGKIFVVQKHHARQLHYDLRLEKNGVLRSWAVPKGVPEQFKEKRLAIETENHPFEYADFEGVIPEGQYGAGIVRILDKGLYELKSWNENKIEVTLKGQKFKGPYVLIKLKKANDKNWLLIKVREKDT